MIQPVSFKGTFSIQNDIFNDSKIRAKILSKYDKFEMSLDRIDFRDEIHETHITIDDKDDNKFKKFLEKLKVPYEYFNVLSRVNKDEIHSRIGIDSADEEAGYTLIEADTEKLYKALDKQCHFSAMNTKDDKNKYDKFNRFIHTNHRIQAPRIYFTVNNTGETIPQISDGRHRLVILRKLGLKTIPVCITQSSIEAAKQSGITI